MSAPFKERISTEVNGLFPWISKYVLAGFGYTVYGDRNSFINPNSYYLCGFAVYETTVFIFYSAHIHPISK
jgi:hypothetical protein